MTLRQNADGKIRAVSGTCLLVLLDYSPATHQFSAGRLPCSCYHAFAYSVPTVQVARYDPWVRSTYLPEHAPRPAAQARGRGLLPLQPTRSTGGPRTPSNSRQHNFGSNAGRPEVADVPGARLKSQLVAGILRYPAPETEPGRCSHTHSKVGGQYEGHRCSAPIPPTWQ